MNTMVNFIKKNILLFIILISGSVTCQQNNFKEIDDLLKKAVASNNKYETLKELEYAKKASVLAEEANDTKRISESYYEIARALSRLELQKESLLYVQKASAQKYAKENLLFQIKLKEVKSANYNTLALSSQSTKELLEIIQLLDKRSDSTSTKILARTYGNLGNRCNDKNKLDSALIYYRLEHQQLKKLSEKDVLNHLAEHYVSMGMVFLAKKDADSSLYYFKKSYQLKLKYHDPKLFMQYFVFGDYYSEQKQYQKALDFYLKVEKTPGFPANHSGFIHLYKRISELYGILGENDKRDQYQKIYSAKQNKILAERNRNIDYALNVILNDEKNEHILSQKKTSFLFFIGILGILILFFFIYKFQRKNIKKKENIITETATHIKQKDEIITQKSFETKELQLKVNDAYLEIIELAKKNDPSFYFRFQEVYPEFQKKLLNISPGLRTSELTLCAYMFLGFSVKDIADYTFKSINTVRNRRQNLRRKFSIPTEEDFGMWLKNSINK